MMYIKDGEGLPVTPTQIQPTMTKDRPISEIIADAFALENSLASLFVAELPQGNLDLEFDPLELINEENEEYGPELARARNALDFKRIETQIATEKERRQRLSEDGGWGIASYLAAGVLDPINLVPIGGAAFKAYKGGSILKGIAAGSIAGGGATAGSELVLQGSQITRTAGETAINISAGLFLGGVLGGSFGAVKKMLDAQGQKGYERVLRGVEDELEVATGTRNMAGSVGAASPDILPLELARKIDSEIEADVASGKLNEADAPEETLRRINDAHKELSGLKENIPVKTLLKILPIMKYQTPTMRGLTQDSRVGRDISSKLMEHGMERAGDRYAEGNVNLPVEARIKLAEGKVYLGIKSLEDAYYNYLTGKGEKPFFGALQVERLKGLAGNQEGKLSQKQFNEEVTRAMRNDGKSEIPDVEKVAISIRTTVYDYIKQGAIDTKYLPEDIMVNPETALSYVNRAWDTDKIGANPQKFIEKIEDWLGTKRVAAELRQGKADVEIADLKAKVKNLQLEKRDIQASIKEGVQKTIQTQVIKAAEETLNEAKIKAAIPTATDALAGAEAASAKAYTNKLREELTERLREAVEGDIEDLTEDTIEAALRRISEDEDVIVAVREELTQPLSAAGEKAGIETLLSPEAMNAAKLAAAEAAGKAIERSLKSRLKEIEDLLSDPAMAEAKSRKQIMAKVKSEVRAEAQKASREAYKAGTKAIDEELDKVLKSLTERKKQSFMDEMELKLDPELGELTQVATDIMFRIKSIGGHRVPHDFDVSDSIKKVKGLSGTPSAFKQRSLLVKDNDFEEFLENDIEVLMRRIVDQVAPSIELRRTFGSDVFEETKAYRDLFEDWVGIAQDRGLFGTKLNKNDAGEFIPDPKSTKKMRQWEKEAATSLNDAAAVFERLKGTYKLPDNPAAFGPRASLAMRQMNNLRMMGGVTVSAIPDLARPVMVHGFGKAFGKGFLPLLTNYAGRKQLSRDLHQMGVITDLILNTRAQKWNGLSEPYGYRSRGEHALSAASDTFQAVNLMAQWNDGVKTMTAMISHSEIIRLIQKADGPNGLNLENLKPKEISYLKGNYIDQGVASDILVNLKQHGKQDAKGLWFSNVEKWEDLDAANRFRAAISRDVDRTIITPGQDIPLWASSPLGKLIFQFKSFGVAASERMLIAGLQQNDINMYSGMLFAVSLGSVAYATKQKLQGKEVNLGLDNLLLEGIDRSGVTGWLMEPNNFIEKATNGSVGLGPLITGRQLSKYQNRNAVGSLIGPSFGTLNTILSSVGMVSEYGIQGETPSQQQIESTIRLLPYSNLMQFRAAVEMIRD